MSITAFWADAPTPTATTARHPNEFDLRRIQRAIASRQRYRYVEPSVLPSENGYLVRSACCSRNIDPEGGVIDIALLCWSETPAGWLLYRCDHAAGGWTADSHFARLDELFERLNRDPDRVFWQ